MQQQFRNTSWGALLGGGLALTVFGLWYYAAVSLTPPDIKDGAAPDEDELNVFFVIVPTLVGIVCGAALGWLAGFFLTFRYLKLLGAAGGLYLFAAWICSAALILATVLSENQGPDANGGGLLLETIHAGFFGALVLSPICGPLILVLVFALERLTEPVES